MHRASQLSLGYCLALVMLVGTAAAGVETAEDSGEGFGTIGSEVHVKGMTFIGSRNNVDEFVVHAATGVFVPGTRIAHLQQVEVAASAGIDGKDFAVRCDRGELNVETSDFLAEGNVEGTIADGRRYEAPWVRYDHEKSLLFSDATVMMHDSTGTFRGDGFRYYVAEERFRLLGNVSLVQAQ